MNSVTPTIHLSANPEFRLSWDGCNTDVSASPEFRFSRGMGLDFSES
jgi:hypothetical protein